MVKPEGLHGLEYVILNKKVIYKNLRREENPEEILRLWKTVDETW